MRCDKCGHSIRAESGPLVLTTDMGSSTVHCKYWFCDTCDEVALIPYETSVKMDGIKNIISTKRGKT